MRPGNPGGEHLLARLARLGLAGLLVTGCGRDGRPPTAAPESPAAFREAATETGLVFHHVNGMSGAMYMPEVVGSGVALFDYNHDGRLDVFVVQGGPLAPGAKPDSPKGPTHRLFRNDLTLTADGHSRLRFTDVTEAAGLNVADYGMGVIAGDYDGDGFVDLYVTCLGRNHLFHNQGNGTFADVTAVAGVGGESDGWHTSAAWVDFDRDGRLDLFVCRYLEWTFELSKPCSSSVGQDYCGPSSYVPARSALYHNLGGGTFAEVSLQSHVSSRAGAALGVVAADFDGDGWPDLLVTNDGMANHLWMNRRDGTFAEEAWPRGCAVNADGAMEANMGVLAADFHNTGRDDLFITHLTKQHGTFFRNLGAGQFADETMRLGLDGPTRPFTGFGVGALDYDNDGRLDIFAANGAVKTIDAQVRAGWQPPLRQRCQLFHQEGGQGLTFNEVTAGDFLKVEAVGRGLAVGDLDNDGRPDLVVANNNGPLRLLLNQAGERNHWLGLRLVAGPAETPHDVLGAVATLERAGQPPLQRRCATDGSYLSSSDPRVLFGLGDSPGKARVRVLWPDGLREAWTGLGADQYHVIRRGTGEKLPPRHCSARGDPSAMNRWFNRLLRSKAVGLVLGAVLVSAAYVLVRSARARPGRAARVVVQEIPPPNLEKAEPIVRRHIQEIRERCEEIVANPASVPTQRGRAFGELGKVYLAYDLAEAAAVCFRNAVALEPEQFRWHYFRAVALKMTGQNAAATAPMARALNLMTTDATARPVDRYAALCTLGDLAIRLNQPAEAKRTLELALEGNPTAVFPLVKLGQMAAQAGQGEQAIAYYEKALAVAPNQLAIRSLLAAEYRRRGDLARAASLAVANVPHQKEASVGFPDPLQTAVGELNRSGAKQNRLGANLLDTGRYRQALEHFAQGVAANPGSAMLHANHGSTLVALGQVDEGLKELEEARRLEPNSDAHRATLYAALARQPATRKRALAEAVAWQKEQPGKTIPLQTLAEVYARLGLYQEAFGVHVELGKLEPTKPRPRIGQALMLAALGKGTEARHALETAAELFPDDSDISSLLARLLVTCPDDTVRDGPKALAIIQRLIAGGYSVVRAETLALALAETGQPEKALEVQRRAIAACGDDGQTVVRQRLQGILRSLEQKKPWRELSPFVELGSDASTGPNN